MNKRLLIFCLATLLFTFHGYSQSLYPFQDTTLSATERVNDLIGRMTLEEKIDLLAGYNDFYLHPCERLGIPAFKLADGPLGLSSWGLFGRATAFPSALSLAASWNKKLAQSVGATYAEEWRARGIHFLLAPGANIYRASKGARNFEYFGEDPFLTSAMVVPFIQAVQDGGVIATVKHFAANDQEFDRYTVSTEVSERALQEIYLPPFKAAVQKAGVKAVMTGYNKVNGIHCTENKHLIDLLKKEWGFQGMLMSDWACTYSAEAAANNGLDLEMGSKEWFTREQLLPLVKSGKVSEEVINDKVSRVYGACISMGFFDRPQLDVSIPTFNPKANQMALSAACEGIVLLKNEKGILPLQRPKVIAVIGPTANPPIVNDRAHSVNSVVYGGGGSSKVHPWYVVNALEGIRQEFPEATVCYTEGISNQFKSRLFRSSKFHTKSGEPGLEACYFALETDSVARESLIMKRTDRVVNNEWWGYPSDESKLGRDYRVCWEGYVDVEKRDSLLFFVDAQGAYRLWVDGELLLDASNSQSFDVRNVALQVQKGESKQVKLEFCNQRSTPAEIRMGYAYQSDIDFSEAKRLATKADVVVFCAGLDGSIELEGRDRPFELPYGQDQLIRQLAEVNPNLIVAIHAGGGVKMTSWVDQASAIVHAFYPGQEGGRALAQVLSGKVNPSAKLPFTIEKSWEDSPAYGRYDETRKEKKVYYTEGIFVGYRGYDRSQTTPLFPFGFGLSYTDFDYSDLSVQVVDRKEKKVSVSFTIKNIGKRDGAEIAQLYVRDIVSKEERPLKELKGFEKIVLNPGESRRVTIELEKDAFSYFNAKQNQWVLEKGAFEILVGASSRDIKLKQIFQI